MSVGYRRRGGAGGSSGAGSNGGVPMSSKYWYLPHNHAGLTTVAPSVNSRMQLWPVVFGRACTLIRVAVAVTAAGDAASTIRLGLFSETNGDPTNLVADWGTVAGDAIAVPQITIATTVAAARYWLALACQGAATTRPTLRAFQSADGGHVGDSNVGLAPSVAGFYKDAVTGALPASVAADGNLPISQNVAIWLKAS